ncbi:MAG: tRNA pseudouridine(55) synthase TruB [Clostridia bacterium]|nr:tRNA pseudouridine(55) synthase TruB [Clostridia bacterium]
MIIPILKPAGMTSHDVAAKLKRAFPIKLKIGHTGTLDPMVTGVLVILTENDTKLSDILPSDKAYKAVMKIGMSTDTQDITGEVMETSEKRPSFEEILTAANSFIGEYSQIPPMYSAVKKNGVPLYKLARKGETVEVEAKTVKLYSIENAEMLAEDEFAFDVSCSSGTYIRTLCADIGKKLGVPCCMKSLTRTKANGFSADQATELEKAIELASEMKIGEIAIPYEEVFREMPKVIIPDNGLNYYMNGGRLALNRCEADNFDSETYTAFDKSGKLLGLAGIANGEFFGKWKIQ